MDFYSIKSSEDIALFLEKTNSLHDGYIVGVQYTNDIHTNVDENGYFINPCATKLIIRILVTSIYDTLVEIEFDALKEWQIKDNLWDMQDTSVLFDDQNFIVWSSNSFINMNELKKHSYVIADSMKWRIIE